MLSVFVYKNSGWFNMCCRLSSYFHQSVTLPLKKLIGIDEFQTQKFEHRSWKGLRSEFEAIIGNLKREIRSNSGECILRYKAAHKIAEAGEKQVGVMDFFSEE